MRARLAALALALGALTVSPHAQAAGEADDTVEPPGAGADAGRAQARTLANEGLRAFRRGDFVEALTKFEQAEALVPAPTIALHRARSLEKLGRMAEALERYATVANAPVAADAPYVHHRAKQDAQLEMAALDPKVPRLKLVVEGEPGPRAEIVVDGRAAPYSGERSLERRLDPGQHAVELRRRDGTRAKGTATLAPGQTLELRLTLPPLGAAPADEDDGSPLHARRENPVAWSGEDQRAAGWVAVSTAGVGLGIALITGAAAMVQGSDLDARCPDGVCPADAFADVDQHDAYRAASTVGWIFAGAFGAAGTVLLLTAPDDGTEASAQLGPRGVSIHVTY